MLKNCFMMLYMYNSQRSHFSAEEGLLKIKLKVIESHARLYELLDEFTALFVILLNIRGIKMHVKVSEDLPQLLSFDRTKYFEILFHLVTNSIKFARLDMGNPKIMISLTFVKITDPVVLRMGWQGYVKTSVIDNGKGISKEKQNSLFYTFRQAHNGMNHGVGVGLSTARAITEATGGRI